MDLICGVEMCVGSFGRTGTVWVWGGNTQKKAARIRSRRIAPCAGRIGAADSPRPANLMFMKSRTGVVRRRLPCGCVRKPILGVV